jgi:hypothetical protein
MIGIGCGLLLRPGSLVKRRFDFSDTHRDCHASPVHLSRLDVHVAEVSESAGCTLGVHLGDGIAAADTTTSATSPTARTWTSVQLSSLQQETPNSAV